MAYEAKPNTGILSKNQRKEKDTHPDITGSINVDGKDYWLSGWAKTGSNGTFYSLSVKPKDGQAPQERRDHPRDDPDDLPF